MNWLKGNFAPSNLGLWPCMFALLLILTACGGGGSGGGSGEYPGPPVVYVITTGDDANDGLSDITPKLTINAAMAIAGSSTEIRVALGTYQVDSQAGAGNPIVLKNGVHLLGGYTADFATRDPAGNTTTITDTSATKGYSDTPNRAVESRSGVTAATVVDGFTINGTIKAGTQNVDAIFNNGGAPTISGNTINGGKGTYAVAIHNVGSSSTITGNSLDGGDGFFTSMAIYNEASSPTITGNTIYGGISSASWGIANSASSPTITGNTINGGTGGATTIAIAVEFSSSPTIRNNTINGGGGTDKSYAFLIAGSSSPTIQNNTMNGGTGGTTSYAIWVHSASATIQNNIMFNTGGTTSYCFYENNATSEPTVFKNNDLYSCSTALYSDFDTTTDITAIGTVNGLSDITGGVSGNVSIIPNLVAQALGNWHLQSISPIEVKEGGLDLSAQFTTDMDDVTRTVPWSMGAYEYD